MEERGLVGRVQELAFLHEALDRCRVVHVYGPGGVGKTRLLHTFAKSCDHVRLDARDIECVPSALLRALAGALGEPDADPFDILRERPQRLIIIDGYEHIVLLDRWIRETGLAALPAGILLVLAGRAAPSAEWRGEPGWGDTLRAIALDNLGPDDTRQLLHARGVPSQYHDSALRFTRGHPLAVCLVADLVARKPGIVFTPEAATEIVQALLARFVEVVDDEPQQLALDACSLLRATTEPILAAMVSGSEGRSLFRWLAGLSFMELGPEGLYPHDLVREVLFHDLKWRNPDRLAVLMERASAYLAAQLRNPAGRDQLRLANDLLFLHSNHPVISSFTPWRGAAGLVVDRAKASDVPGLVGVVARHEGATAAGIARRWLAHRLDQAVVVRGDGEEPMGFALTIRLDRVPRDHLSGDPIALQAARYVSERKRASDGEAVLLTRFLMTRDTYQEQSATQSLLGSQSMRMYLLTPRLTWTFTCMADPERWQSLLESAFGARMLPPVELDGRRYGLFWHCFRDQTPTGWLAWLARRGTGADASVDVSRVLDRKVMHAAVKSALRDFHREVALASNPLANSILLSVANADSTHRPAALRALLQSGADVLKAEPRGEKLFAALLHTYLEPAPTQDTAAARGGMPFGTYRRYLVEAVKLLADWLWHRQRNGV